MLNPQFEGQLGPQRACKSARRNARALARLFEFEEFEEGFEIHPDTLRPFGWRRIAFPKGDHRRPPAFFCRRFGESNFGSACGLLEGSGVIFWLLEGLLGTLGGLLGPLGRLLGASWGLLGGSWGLLGGVLRPLGRDPKKD